MVGLRGTVAMGTVILVREAHEKRIKRARGRVGVKGVRPDPQHLLAECRLEHGHIWARGRGLSGVRGGKK